MAITSFNGEGGHVLRRVSFVPNEEGQLFVAERDGVHESDVRRGITLEDSTIGYLGDDFMNVHSTMLVVLRCDSSSCLLINPHVEGGTVLDTTYAMNSLLEGARAGDTMSFFPLLTNKTTHRPKTLTPLVDKAVIKAVSRETDQAVVGEASEFAMALFNDTANGVKHFAGGGHVVDVWSVQFGSALSSPIPNASLVSVNELGSAGARFINNSFTNTTCSARWKSSNAIIANNSWANAGHNLEITYLQPYLEGPPLISNITLSGNTFYYGAGVNPIHPNPIDTSGIVETGNCFLAAQHLGAVAGGAAAAAGAGRRSGRSMRLLAAAALAAAADAGAGNVLTIDASTVLTELGPAMNGAGCGIEFIEHEIVGGIDSQLVRLHAVVARACAAVPRHALVPYFQQHIVHGVLRVLRRSSTRASSTRTTPRRDSRTSGPSAARGRALAPRTSC